MPERSQRSNVAPAASGDWTVQAADTVDRLVGTVRDKAVVPVTGIARWLVFGLLAAIVGVAALVLLAIGVVRALDAYIPGDDNVWAAHLVTGAIFVLPGLFLWSKRKPRQKGND